MIKINSKFSKYLKEAFKFDNNHFKWDIQIRSKNIEINKPKMFISMIFINQEKLI